jgi:hypothetical protein
MVRRRRRPYDNCSMIIEDGRLCHDGPHWQRRAGG